VTTMGSPVERAVTDAAIYTGIALFMHSFAGPGAAGLVLFVFGPFVSSAASRGEADE